MDYTRASFVKIYTEIRPTARLFGFHGRMLMEQLVKSANRAGVLKLPEELLEDIPAAVASVIECPDVPWVEEHLPKILRHGSVEIKGEHLILRNYHSAQYSPVHNSQSTKASKAKTNQTVEAVEAGLIEVPFWMEPERRLKAVAG